jgi:tetratricopeptide (TPR) repeat protein
MHTSLLIALPLFAAAPALATDHIDELIDQGRGKLEAGDVDGALEFFNQADAETRSTLRTRMWVLRAHFEKAQRLNDAFAEVDGLAKENKGSDIDYLYGMGSYFKAKKYVAEGVQDGAVQFAFADASTFLDRALKADGEKYRDAWYPLADAAWRSMELEVAEHAIAQAVQRWADDPGMYYLQGRVAFTLYETTKVDDEKGAAAQLENSIAAFKTALDKVKQPKRHANMVANLNRQLGLALQWKGDTKGAVAAYAESISWDPNAFGYSDYWTSLGLDNFLSCLETGAIKYEARYGKRNSGDATLLWWLGSAYYSAKRYPECEATYLKVIEKWPAYADSWFYVAMSRYFGQDYDGAIDAWHEHWKATTTGLVASISSNQKFNLEVISYVIGVCAAKGIEGAGDGAYDVRAAFLCEVRCAVDGSNWEYFDNWGLFARNGGAFLQRRNSKKEDGEMARHLFEKSWEAYNEALRLAPEKPHLYNDAAVILHYYLERDYDRAIELYVKAGELATRLLEAGGLSEADKALIETAKRDSANNLADLKKKMEGGD